VKHLQDKEYYEKLYDSFTIKRCRAMEKRFLELEPAELKKLSLKRRKKLAVSVGNVAIHFLKGDRYSRKEQTVLEWMVKDRIKDEKLDSAKAPEHIRCPNCHSIMDFESKDLYWGSDDPLRVLFLYRCKDCRKGTAIFDNGEEYKPSPMLCKKCSSEVKTTYKRVANKIDTTYACLNKTCNYKEVDTLDLTKKEEKEVVDPDYEKDRQRFLMTDKEGLEYLQMEAQLKQLNEHLKEQEERDKHKDLYDKVAKLKKLTLVEVEKLLKNALEEKGYLNLHLAPPTLDKDIRVDFTVQESTSGKHEYDSRMNLKKLINATLPDTNWRLMTYGIEYRLGILSGSIRGYEREEDLLNLVKKQK